MRKVLGLLSHVGITVRFGQNTGGAPPLTILVAEDQWLGLLYPGEITTLDDYVRCSKRLRDAMEPHIISMLAEAKCRGRTCFSNQ